MVEFASVSVEAGDSVDSGGEGIGGELAWLSGELLKQSCTEPGDVPRGAVATASLQALGYRGAIEKDHELSGYRDEVLIEGAIGGRLGGECYLHGVRRPRVGRGE